MWPISVRTTAPHGTLFRACPYIDGYALSHMGQKKWPGGAKIIATWHKKYVHKKSKILMIFLACP
jgi:hypothetical protein